MPRTTAPSQKRRTGQSKSSNLVDGYRVTVVGQYRAHTANGKTPRAYKPESFELPRTVVYKDGLDEKKYTDDKGREHREIVIRRRRVNSLRIAKYLIRNFYLPSRLHAKYDDYESVRVMNISSRQAIRIDASKVRDVTKTPISEMEEHELMQFHALNGLNTQLDIYPDLADKRAAIEQEIKDQKRAEAAKRRQAEHDPLLDEPDPVSDTTDVVDSFETEDQDLMEPIL